MDQQVGNEKYRIIPVLSHFDFHCRPVFFDDNTMQCKGQRHPLILFHTAIIMGIQVGKSPILIERVLLDVQPGRINMGPQYIHPFFQGAASDMEHHNGFIHADMVYFVPCLQSPAFPAYCFQFPVTFCLHSVDQIVHTFPFCLSLIQEFHIFFCKTFQFL